MVRQLSDALALPIEWARPSDDLWVATQVDAERTWFLGFVEHVHGEFIGVDGYGDLLGRYSALAAALDAFAQAAATAEAEPVDELELQAA